jgi:transcriptional regulator with XRE-family HTH domain
MAHKIPRGKTTIADRCREVVLALGAGNKLQAARELGLSQSVVNRVANGKRKPSRAFLEKVAAHERVNAAFLFDDDGDPLLPPIAGTLPVSNSPLSDVPAKCNSHFGTERHTIPQTLESPGRYFVRIPDGHPVTRDRRLQARSHDLLLFEADPERIADMPLDRAIGAINLKLKNGSLMVYVEFFGSGRQLLARIIDYPADAVASRSDPEQWFTQYAAHQGFTVPERRHERKRFDRFINKQSKSRTRKPPHPVLCIDIQGRTSIKGVAIQLQRTDLISD